VSPEDILQVCGSKRFPVEFLSIEYMFREEEQVFQTSISKPTRRIFTVTFSLDPNSPFTAQQMIQCMKEAQQSGVPYLLGVRINDGCGDS